MVMVLVFVVVVVGSGSGVGVPVWNYLSSLVYAERLRTERLLFYCRVCCASKTFFSGVSVGAASLIFHVPATRYPKRKHPTAKNILVLTVKQVILYMTSPSLPP